jgi:hypothetical protein
MENEEEDKKKGTKGKGQSHGTRNKNKADKGDREEHITESFVSSATMEEALLKCCSHYDMEVFVLIYAFFFSFFRVVFVIFGYFLSIFFVFFKFLYIFIFYYWFFVLYDGLLSTVVDVVSTGINYFLFKKTLDDIRKIGYIDYISFIFVVSNKECTIPK